MSRGTSPEGLAALLLEMTSEALLAINPATFEIAAVNRAAAELLDQVPDDLIGRPITEIESALSDVFYWEEIRQGASGEVTEVESLYRRRDGELIGVTKDARRIRSDTGDWLILRVRDERTRLREEDHLAQLASQLKATIEATGDGILVIDTNGQVVNLNRRLVQMWDLPEHAGAGGVDALWDSLARRAVAPAAFRHGIDAAARDPRGESFDVIELVDGRFFERRARPQLVGDRIVGRVFSFHDITQRVAHEHELLRMRDRAEQANLAKSRFLATMSHEIRTPMNGILGMAQLLLIPGLTEEERLAHARTLLDSGKNLLTLLNDILDLSKIEAGKLDLAPMAFLPRQLLGETVDLFSGTAMLKGLTIAATWGGPEERLYWGDALRLKQVLSNLVSNAVKFTANGSVTLDATEVEHAAGESRLEFSVTDTGIGIPADKQAQMFEPFTQADASTTRQYGGTGLGLAIVRHLVQMMGGDITVSSTPGAGACFRFHVCLPIAEPAESVEPGTTGTALNAAQETVSQSSFGEATPRAAAAGASVLVAEDNTVNRLVIESMLCKLKVRILCVEDGQQAVEAVMSGADADLLFMDCQMPVLDGFAATERIRRWEREGHHPRLPIVALTAGAFDEDRESCIAAGMDDFMTKPISIDRLAAMIGKWRNARGLDPVALAAPHVASADSAGPKPTFDPAHLLQQLGQDRPLAAQICTSALRDFPGYLDRLSQALGNDDSRATAQALHVMKSLSGQIGGACLYEMLKEADQRLVAGEKPDGAVMQRLRDEHDALAALIVAWMEEK